jgi:hypothetical protein
MTLLDAYELVKQQVPELNINDGFKLQLMKYPTKAAGFFFFFFFF